MFVIDVLPLLRTAPESLSYRSTKDIPIGSIVDITVRKKKTQGIVLSSMHVSEAKGMLKTATFQLSKSTPSISGKIPEEILAASLETAEYYATTSGAVLSAMFSEHVRLSLPLPNLTFDSTSVFKRITCEMSVHDRVVEYKKHIEKNTSVGFATQLLTPTLAELLFWQTNLSEYSPITLSGEYTSLQRERALEKAIESKSVVICTPSFAWVPIQNLGSILIDRVSAGTYTLPKRPYLCVPYAVEAVARARKVPVVIGDYPLPLEYRPDTKAPLRSKNDSKALKPIQICDVRSAAKKPIAIQQDTEEGPWKIFPNTIRTKIRNEVDSGGRVLVLATRKGYAPAVVCKDCGQAQTDERGMPFMFVMTNGKRQFITSDNQSIAVKDRRCQRCDSWNILPLGIGIERVIEELTEVFPDVPLHAFLPTRQSKRAMQTALSQSYVPGTISVGTGALLPWLYAFPNADSSRLPLGIISSADSLLSLPFWRSRERFIRLGLYMREVCSEVSILTRHPEDTAVEVLRDTCSTAFWNEESAIRAAVQYPPKGTLILLTTIGSSSTIQGDSDELIKEFADYIPSVLPPRSLGRDIQKSLVITLPDQGWPNPSLSARIRNLSPHIRVRIDPETIW